MPPQLETEASRVADLIIENLQPLIEEYQEALAWHTKSEAATYMAGYRACTIAVREAVTRALEDGVFRDLIASGEIPRYKSHRRRAA